MTAHRPSPCAGKRVVVVGAARSGVAAAELLVRRGAHGHADRHRATTIADERRLRDAGVGLELGGHRDVDAARRGSDRAEPGRAAAQPAIAAARAAGVPVIGELELASRWLRGRIVAITGTKGKSTTTTLTGRMLEAGGHRVLVGGNIGHALSAQVDDSHRGHDPRRRGEQLPARERRHVPAVDRGAAQLLARPPRSPRRASRSTRRPRRGSSRNQTPTTGRC